MDGERRRSNANSTNPVTAAEAKADPAVRLRPARPTDLPRVVEIYLKAYQALGRYYYQDPEEARDYLQWCYEEEPEGFTVAEAETEADGRVVGFVSVHTWGAPPERQGEVVEVAVDPAWQGRGLGQALLKHAEAYARRRGCRTLVLWVGRENARAIRLYKKLGYEDVGRYERWIKMAKPLQP